MCHKTQTEENSEEKKETDGDLVSKSIGPKLRPNQKAL